MNELPLDAIGRRRSPATFSEFKKGQPPRNKGLTLPAEPLTQTEIAAITRVIPTDTPAGIRLRAMVELMYRAEAKIGTLTSLSYRHYDERAGVLTLPGVQQSPTRAVRLDPTARRHLEQWLETRSALKVSAVSPLFCIVLGRSRGRQLGKTSVASAIRALGIKAGVRKRVTSEGLRKSRAHHRDTETGRFEATIVAYVSDESFRARYPLATQKWSDAHSLLETAPDRMGSMVGHLCREAIIEFSSNLVDQYKLGPFEANKTKDKIRAVFKADDGVSRTVQASLVALVAYWESVSDLVQRQEHGTDLAEEDGRRLVFQTMLVMREIDVALARKPNS